MSILVCGSMAYDNILVFYDTFNKHLLADQLDNINVSFFAPDMRKEFGGCAGNIAYNLKLLGLHPYIVASVGSDFEPYASHLEQLELSQDLILKSQDYFTAQAFITSDEDNNQISIFHPGAMQVGHHNVIPQTNEGQPWTLAIIGPDSRESMLAHANRLAEIDVPFIFDPGQATPILQKEDLLVLLSKASWLVCNEYEYELIANKTGLSAEDLGNQVDAFILTQAEKGSSVYSADGMVSVKAGEAKEVDPTGCGDAYRAGLIYGIINELEWQKTAKIAGRCAEIKLASLGGQNHRYDLNEVLQAIK